MILWSGSVVLGYVGEAILYFAGDGMKLTDSAHDMKIGELTVARKYPDGIRKLFFLPGAT